MWFSHKTEVWALGEVTGGSDPESPTLTVDYEGSSYTVKKGDEEAFDPSHLDDYDDVASLNNLNQAPLLGLLRRRYYNDQIYTNVSNISISFNPYKWIDGLYDNPESEKFTKNHVPHVYSVASIAYDRMCKNSEDQSVIVSGESGAGKTEACKKVMKFLADTSSHVAGSSSSSSTISVEQKVMDCNPFLEAFGNAKTVRNDNSSRFGKFIKIEYVKGRIVGASMCHYLLEKSRVVGGSPGERNYHIFYQLLSGASEKQKTMLQLKTASDYRLLNQGALTVDFVDDAADFAEVCRSLMAVGATKLQLDTILELLAGVLHLGNVEFVEDGEGNAQVSEASKSASLPNAMKLLQCKVLDVKLTSRIVKAKGRSSVYTVPLKLTQAREARDALSKAIYDNLFSYLIQLCNDTLQSESVMENFIGILDIFGFEIFKVNSFEQLCINYANEKLQSLFNHTVFVSEQEMYKNEGIDCAYIEFQNNQPCVDLIEKKPTGLLPILDEICMLGRNTDTDMTYLTQVNNAHRGKTKHFGVSRFAGNDAFIVKHFAGDVTYCVQGFISKNSDKLLPDLESAMLESKSDFIRTMFENASVNSQNQQRSRSQTSVLGKAPTTIGYKFKNQLGGLYSDILSTTPHYIRCVKPNANKAPQEFDAVMVMEQLKCNGTLEMVRIRREGYPMREDWEDLWQVVLKFEYWKESHVDPKSDPKVGCPKVFEMALPPGYFQVAKSGKVFLKHDTYEQLATWKLNTNATFVQTRFRCWYGRKSYKQLRRRIISLQRCIGGFMARQKYKKEVVKITKCQAMIRGFVVAKILMKRRRAIKTLDDRLHAYVTGKRAKAEYMETRANVLKVQSLMRGRAAKKEYQDRLYQKLVVEENKKKDKMASIIGSRLKKKSMATKLESWVQEAFSAAAWGDVEQLKNLVTCGSSDWAVLRDVKNDLPNVRDRMDGMKTLLHVTSINGNTEAVKLLVMNGAIVNVVDSEGNTPLIRSAGCGDSHLPVSKLLVENCESVATMINRINGEKNSALDVSLAEGAESDEGSTETVKLLLKFGAQSAKGAGQEKIQKLIEEEQRRKQEKIDKEQRLEQEKLEAARKERELDPHFQFLKMQNNVDNSKSEADKLERERKERQEQLERQQREKVQEVQKKRVMRRTSTRQSIFQTGGGLLGNKGKNLLGDDSTVASGSASSTAESKTDGSSGSDPVKRKVKRRVSAKQTDSTWAVRSNVPYRLIAKSVVDGGPEPKRSESIASEISSLRSSNMSHSDSIIEEEDDEETSAREEVAVSPDASEPVLTEQDAFSYATSLVKLTQIIQDMSTTPDRKGWYYLNADGGEEGPFASEWMHSWLSDKALNGSTQVRFGDGLNFVMLSSLIPHYDSITMEFSNPFELDAAGELSGVNTMLSTVFKSE